MTMRGFLAETIGALLDFGRVTASTIGSATQSVLATIEGDETPDGTETREDQELWGNAAILVRPAAPTSAGAMEVVYLRRGDELIGIAHRDLRWQVELEAGEVVIRALSANAATITLKPNGDIILGAGTEAMVLGDTLKSWLQAHTHPTGVGPSGPPTQAGTLSTILSTKQTVE